MPDRDDGVCLTTVTDPWGRKREELAVKRLPDPIEPLKDAWSRHITAPIYYSYYIIVWELLIRIYSAEWQRSR